MENVKAIIDLGIDLSFGKVTNFSVDEANETFRRALNELAGMEDGKFDYKKFRRNQTAIFEIIEEVLDVRLEEGLKNQFERFVDYRSVAFGDKLQFRPPNRELFRVSSIAGGTNNLRRQRIGEMQPFQIETGWEGVKFYDELERFLAGRVDWNDLVNRVERSFTNKIQETIYTAIKGAYSGVTAPFSHTGAWDLEEFNLIVEHVRAATGLEPMVIGTRIAVSKAVPNSNYISDSMKDSRNQNGFFETVDGIQFGIIPQAHKVGTYDFIIDNDFLLILPNGNEKMIKFVMEGGTLIKEVTDQQNADDSQEYVVRRKYGAAAVSGDIYGVYILQ